MKNLKEQIDEFRTNFKTIVPPEKIALIERALREQALDLERIAKVGDKIKDFELLAIDGRKIQLSRLLKDGPVVLTFYRGGWCPYCNLELRSYQRSLSQFKSLGAQLIALSPEKIDEASKTATANELSFLVATDDRLQVAKGLGLVFELPNYLRDLYTEFGHPLSEKNSEGLWELPVPATFIIGQDGRISFSYINLDYRVRLDPLDLLKELEGVK